MQHAANSDTTNTVWAASKLYHTIMLIFKESGGSFSALEPVMQALVQAVTERIVHSSGATVRWACSMIAPSRAIACQNCQLAMQLTFLMPCWPTQGRWGLP